MFGTRVEVSVYGADESRSRTAVAAVMQEFQRLHNLLHAWKPSALSELNAAIALGKTHAITPELAAMLRDAAQLSEQSGGLFNPALGGLVQLWGFHADGFQSTLPDAKQLAALVAAQPQMSDLVFSSTANPSRPPQPPHAPLIRGELNRGGEEPTAPSPASPPDKGAGGLGRGGEGFVVKSRNRTVQLDLGGYAKGYALDRAAALLKQQGIQNALINIGGNVMALGTHGQRPWRVGIQHPRKPGPLATLELHDGEAIGTSGDYQRYFELNGKRYSHLIDPRSGQPASGVQAVTVLTQGAAAGVMSDAASKPLFIAGPAAWLASAHKMQLNEIMLIDAGGTVHLTAAMRLRLEFTDKDIVWKLTQ